jgi:hypothetical protein
VDPAGWETVLLNALSGGTVCVIDVVRAHLGREPTSSELNAARRAAHRLAEHGAADTFRTRQTTPAGSTRLVLALTRPGGQRPVSDPPVRRGRPRSEVQMARTLVTAAVTAGRSAARLDVSRIEPEAAAELAGRLRQALVELGRLEQQLSSRSP